MFVLVTLAVSVKRRKQRKPLFDKFFIRAGLLAELLSRYAEITRKPFLTL